MTEYDMREKDRLELLQAVGQSITSWALVEDALYKIFHVCIGSPSIVSSAAAFLAVENFRSKLAMTDAVVRTHLMKNQLVSVWKRRTQDVIKLSQRRNFIAHGQVVILRIGKSKPRAVVMGSFNDWSSHIKYGTGLRDSRVNLSDVNSIIAESINLTKRLHEFCKKLPRLAKP